MSSSVSKERELEVRLAALTTYRSPSKVSPGEARSPPPGGGAGAPSAPPGGNAEASAPPPLSATATTAEKLMHLIATERVALENRRKTLKQNTNTHKISILEAGKEFNGIQMRERKLNIIEKNAKETIRGWQNYSGCGGLSSCMYSRPALTVEALLAAAPIQLERADKNAKETVSQMNETRSQYALSLPKAPPVPTHTVGGGKRRHRTSKKTKRSKKLRTRRHR